MKKILYTLVLIVTSIGFSQDLSMQNGTFTRCAPDKFYDSGGEFGPYGNDENFVTTICPQNADEFIILNFLLFTTQTGPNQDVMNIYDGDDTSATLIGTYVGPVGAFEVSASDTNTSGCLTVEFISNGSGNINGWEAEILCATPCQDIIASIDSTIPTTNASGVIGILPGDSVYFSGSATFSIDGTDATYNWDFGDTNTATGTDVTNTFTNPGTYTVTLTVADVNPQGCSNSTTITVFVLGPNVVVDQVTFTPTQLIEDVLVDSPCASVSNIISSTGIDYSASEPNGIGYFFSNGVDFPFEDGILLTSGDASRAGGPNEFLGDGTVGTWPGDASLDLATGIDSNNASFIQFDFTPLADSISFDFLMASEEYNMGSFECDFSDAFAFLLTDSMGNVTNLAVLPGTTTPILVTNIHLANSSCPAINPQYFGGYTADNMPPTSFDGRTNVFTAQSAVVPGENYTIKLVIADDGDGNYDSGVFIKAGSFNLGGNLGDDITIDAGTAECNGTEIILDTSLDAAVHIWYKDDVEIVGEVSSTITVTEPGVYYADFDFAGVCTGSADPIIIEFRESPTANPAQNLIVCSATGTEEFNLTDNDDDIIGTQDPLDFIVSYHLTEQDALDNLGALPSPYTNVSNPQTIWARIADVTQTCVDTTDFILSAAAEPTINPASDLELCDDDSNDGFEEFDLSAQTLTILGSQSATDFTVSYYLNFADADADDNALPLSYTNTENSQPIFVRVESAGDSSCYNASAVAVFNLIVHTKAIATAPGNMLVCDDPSNDGFATFNLSSQEATILGSQDPVTFMVSFHNTQEDADTNVNGLPTNYTNGTPNIETVYVRVEDPANPSCYDTTSFDLIINPLPTIEAVTALQVCDDDTDGFVGFPLSTKVAEFLNGQTGVAVSFHETLAQANSDTAELADGYINTMANQIIFVRLENTTTNCVNINTLQLEVLPNPIANATTALEVCDDNADGFALFDLSLKDVEVNGSQSGMTVNYYLNLANAEAGANPLPTNYTNTTVDAQEIFARIENGTTGCYATTTLQLIVNPKPTIIAVTDYELCDDNNAGDDEEEFDLSTKTAEILDGQVNVTVTYYANQADADSGLNALPNLYTNTSNPQPITAVLTNTVTNCSSSTTFNLIVNPLPALVDPTALEVCDDGTPDGITEMDLSLKNTEITGNNPNYSVSYYETLVDAQSEMNVLPTLYTNTVNGQIIIARVDDINTGCYDTTTLELIVQQAPIAFDPQPLRYCDPDNDGFGVFTLTNADNEITGGASGLSVTYHETQTNADNGVNAIDTTVDYNNIVQNTQTLYVRVESATITTDCATIVELELIVEPTPQLPELITSLEECDDISADGFATFDLTSKNAEILNGQDPLQYDVSFYETQVNAETPTNPIANSSAYINTDDFNQIIWVRVEDNTTVEGCYKITSLELIVNPLPVLLTPAPLEKCDVNNPGDEEEAFTLEEANDEILNGQTGITLTHYETLADAENAVNQIFSPYVNTTSNPQTIFVRAENDITGCHNLVTVTLRVNPIPSPEPNPDPIEVCDDDNDGFAEFDLEQRTVEITNGELDRVITYHETQTDAETGDNPITGLYTNIVANNQMIYVRSENTLTNCYSLTTNTLELIVHPAPEVPLTIDPFTICDNDDNGISQFNLTTKNEEIFNGQDETAITLTYHLSLADAETGNNPIINVGNYTNTANPQEIYVRLFNPTTSCLDTGFFELRVDLPPVAIQPTQLNACDDLGEVPGDEITVFDLTVKDAEITGGNASWSVAYYETNADAQAQINEIPDPTQYSNTVNAQTLFVVVTDTDTGCVDFVTLTIRVQPNPTPTLVVPNIELCDDVNTGDGVEVFDLTENEALILNFEPNVTATYYENQDDANAGTNAIADRTMYTNTTTPEQEIYVRVTNDFTGCYALVDFMIIVHPLPDVVAVTDFIQCELNTDGFDSFDLTTKDAEVLNGQDPIQFVVSYHESLADAEAEMNDLVSPYTNISNPQQIFVTITNTITGCSISTQSFNIEVQEGARANPDPMTFEQCDDNMETDGDTTNDSTQFDLTTQDTQILDGQDSLNYMVTYYETEEDANLNVNPLPTLYENLVNPQVIYARVDNNTPDVAGNDTSICYAITALTLQVNPLPKFAFDESYILCVNTDGSEVLEPLVLDTELSTADYSFVWFLNTTTELVGETGSSIMPTEGGTYSVLVTNLVTGCENGGSTEVMESERPMLVVELVTQAFAENHVIEALATGTGENYEYSLDDGPWQDQGTFTNVSAGAHLVTARDKNGCGIATAPIFVLDYPPYFTPNGDGYNDTWNIEGIGSDAKIYIFDRYGKLLKQLSPSGSGWNGTFNGNNMPTDGYWFTVEYTEPGTTNRKEFKAHFTLKR